MERVECMKPQIQWPSFRFSQEVDSFPNLKSVMAIAITELQRLVFDHTDPFFFGHSTWL